ncbi:DUF4215 domain-containing protein, partial [Myxococcota bacterium]|nr:DUF4215 domain-containing protein [Myxococcota bacterium]
AACLPICGNGQLHGVEACDDGNTANGDGCNAACTLEAGWSCPAPGAACATTCGDGIVAGLERCDDGNTTSGDGCDATCVPTCGNAIVEPQYGEQCDDGNSIDGDACEADCTTPRCGNTIVDVGEVCDDGNAVEGDGCDTNCTVSACGNGIVAGTEECDDGNTTDGDGCQASCTITALNAAITADGVYRDWTSSTGAAQHFTMLTADCSGATYLFTTVAGRRESFIVPVTAVPAGAVITEVEVTPCAASHTGAAASFSTFLRVDDVQTADGAPYSVSGTTMTTLATTRFDLSPDVVRLATTTLEAGVVLSGGTGGVRLGGLSVRVRYFIRPFPAPTNVVATHLGNGDVRLTWSDQTTWESSFEVQRSVEHPDVWQLVANTGIANVVTIDDRFLPVDQTIHYRVRAIEVASNTQSPFSIAGRVVTAVTAPSAPRNAFVVRAPTGVHTLSWTDTSPNEEGFAIERRVDGGAFAEVARVDLATTTWDDGACLTGLCEYRVIAYNGIGVSAASNVATPGATLATGPDVRLTITGNHSSIVGTQRTDFTLTYENVGDAAVDGAWVITTVPVGAQFLPERSAIDWQCHARNADARLLTITLGRALRALRVKFPNLKQVLLSTHHYAGFSPLFGTLTEPFAYEAGFAVKRVIDAQIRQMRTGALDPLVGDVSYTSGRAAWTTWGFYHWANGATPNGYGTSWSTADLEADLLQLSAAGRAKAASLFLEHLLSAPWTGWARTTAIAPPTLSVVAQPATMIPLVDMTPAQRYRGLEGGLYAGGTNQIPADHEAAGLAAGAAVVPLDVAGNPSPTGVAIMAGLGYANSSQTMNALLDAANVDPRVRPMFHNTSSATFEIINGAIAAGYLQAWAQLDSGGYVNVRNRLGATFHENQVQVVWLNVANNVNTFTGAPLLAIAEGTECRAPLGRIAAGATRTIPFSVRSSFVAPTELAIAARIEDDGSGGTDRAPADNRASGAHTPALCPALGAPGCDVCASPTPPVCDDGNPANGLETCQPNVGCVPGTPP